LYADDLLLLSASVEGLQRMLDVCKAVSVEVEMEFNCKKCSCTIVGPASHNTISDMKLGEDVISWSGDFKYLGIHFFTGKCRSVDTHMIKSKFFATCNCIFGNMNCLSDLVKLSMIEAYGLPILLFATAALKMSHH